MSTIVAMLDDLGQMKRLIDSELAEVERKKPPPSIHMALIERRDKLRETIDSLEMRLATLRNGEGLPV